jgi:hypothetical protein
MKAKALDIWCKYQTISPWTLSEQQCLLAISELHQAVQDSSGMDQRQRLSMENLYEHLLSWTGTGHEMLVVHHGEGPHPAGHVWMWERNLTVALATPLVKVVLPTHGRIGLAEGDDDAQEPRVAQVEVFRTCPEWWPGGWVLTDGVASPVSPERALATARTFQSDGEGPWPHLPWDQGLILKARLRQIRRERV